MNADAQLEVIGAIQTHWMVYPDSKDKSTNRTKSDIDHSQVGQSKFVDNLLQGRRNGFYVECGAFDGVSLSNSLYFEEQRNWTGLLIEANHELYSKLLHNRPRSYRINACLSIKNESSIELFDLNQAIGGLHRVTPQQDRMGVRVSKVRCFPLADMLDALGVNHVDFFSLDIEGPELQVLQTIPFDRISIDVITIEYAVNTSHKRPGESIEKTQEKRLKAFREFFHSLGNYDEVGIIGNLDIIFKKKMK